MSGAESARRIAMWSGPRNLSTALMYAFGNRADCACWDEPFYAFYLENSGIDHPLSDAIVAAGEPDFDRVVERCLGPVPAAKPLFYQKHMTHHMLPGYDRTWALGLTNAFLIRSPERVLASYARKRDHVTLRDIGFMQQCEIFDMVADRLGAAPPLIDADDLLADPPGILAGLCADLGIAFDDDMLSWPAGPKSFDGVWAPHWYGAAWRSTGFTAETAGTPELSDHLRRIADVARPYYERMRRFTLVPEPKP
jgi:hypothetical protein